MKLSVCSMCQLGKKTPVVSLAIPQTINFSFFDDGMGTFSFTFKDVPYNPADGEGENPADSKPGNRALEVCGKCSGIIRTFIADFAKRAKGFEIVAARQDGDWTPPAPKVAEVVKDNEDQDDEDQDDSEDNETDDDDQDDDDQDDEDEGYEEMSPEDAKAYREYQRAKGIKIAPESDFEEEDEEDQDDDEDDEDQDDDGLGGLFDDEDEEEEEAPEPPKAAVKSGGLKVSTNKAKPAASGEPKRNGSGRIVHDYSTADLRVWARANGYPNMKDKGAIPAEAKRRYEAFLALQK